METDDDYIYVQITHANIPFPSSNGINCLTAAEISSSTAKLSKTNLLEDDFDTILSANNPSINEYELYSST